MCIAAPGRPSYRCRYTSARRGLQRGERDEMLAANLLDLFGPPSAGAKRGASRRNAPLCTLPFCRLPTESGDILQVPRHPLAPGEEDIALLPQTPSISPSGGSRRRFLSTLSPARGPEKICQRHGFEPNGWSQFRRGGMTESDGRVSGANRDDRAREVVAGRLF